MRKIVLYTILLSAVLFASCVSEEILDVKSDNENIEILFLVSDFRITNFRAATRATDPQGTLEERQVNDFYLYLFPGTGNSKPLEKYYIDAGGTVHQINPGATPHDGNYIVADRKVTLDMTRTEAGSREVYIVANSAGNTTLQTALNNVETIGQLEAVVRSSEQPWSPNISTPLLMSGNASYDFITEGNQLNSVSLTRALAKVELNITLKPEHQGEPVIQQGIAPNTTQLHQYHYRFLNFDQDSYVLKPADKESVNLASSPTSISNPSGWVVWEESGTVTGYTLDSNGKVTEMTLVTYLNERDLENPAKPRAAIDIQVPFNDGGALPPPEFAFETYTVLLDTEVKRNHWYLYDVQIGKQQ